MDQYQSIFHPLPFTTVYFQPRLRSDLLINNLAIDLNLQPLIFFLGASIYRESMPFSPLKQPRYVCM